MVPAEGVEEPGLPVPPAAVWPSPEGPAEVRRGGEILPAHRWLGPEGECLVFRSEVSLGFAHGARTLAEWMGERPRPGRVHLDLETTGLQAERAQCVMAGIVRVEAAVLIVEQAVARDAREEAAVVAWCSAALSAAQEVVTFNGASFDLPFLRRRAEMLSLAEPSWRAHLDLLHEARRHRGRGSRCSLSVLESELLGLEREGDPGSAQSARDLQAWLERGDVRALQGVLLHNRWDLLSLPVLAELFSARSGFG